MPLESAVGRLVGRKGRMAIEAKVERRGGRGLLLREALREEREGTPRTPLVDGEGQRIVQLALGLIDRRQIGRLPIRRGLSRRRLLPRTRPDARGIARDAGHRGRRQTQNLRSRELGHRTVARVY